MLTKVVNAFKGHPGLLAWKGVDEPRNPFRGEKWIRPAGLVRGYEKLKALDPDHPVVIIQTPRNTVAELSPYRPALDITGADIYPVSYPPGIHAGRENTRHQRRRRRDRDDARRRRAEARVDDAPDRVERRRRRTPPSPTRVPRFPSLYQERFMAYQAIANGARGLNFFGGHMTQVALTGGRGRRLELELLGAASSVRSCASSSSPELQTGARRADRDAGSAGGHRGRSSS